MCGWQVKQFSTNGQRQRRKWKRFQCVTNEVYFGGLQNTVFNNLRSGVSSSLFVKKNAWSQVRCSHTLAMDNSGIPWRSQIQTQKHSKYLENKLGSNKWGNLWGLQSKPCSGKGILSWEREGIYSGRVCFPDIFYKEVATITGRKFNAARQLRNMASALNCNSPYLKASKERD